MFWYLLLILGTVVLDRAVKYWAAVELQPIYTLPIIPDVFHLTYAENTGMAFSLFSDKTDLLAIVSLISVAFLFVALFTRWLPRRMSMLALSLLIGGAIGNMIDRMAFGYVIDLFDFRLINYAIFNVADSFINIGAFFLVLDCLLALWREERDGFRARRAGKRHHRPLLPTPEGYAGSTFIQERELPALSEDTGANPDGQ